MKKNELYNISEAYSKVYESDIGEPPEHKNKMINLASEIAAIATRISSMKARRGDGDRLMQIAHDIEGEYRSA